MASVRFPTDKDSKKSKGYAFVDIHRVSDARRVRYVAHCDDCIFVIVSPFELFCLFVLNLFSLSLWGYCVRNTFLSLFYLATVKIVTNESHRF